MSLGELQIPIFLEGFCLLTPRPALPLAYIHVCLLHRPEDRDALPRMWPKTHHGGQAASSRGQGPGALAQEADDVGSHPDSTTEVLRDWLAHRLSVPQFPCV